MALGRQGERQADLMIGWAELPRSPWFDSAKFPRAVFRSSAISALGGGRFQAAGKLELKGSSRDLVVPVTIVQSGAQSTASGEFVNFSNRHLETVNTLFLDGHVKALKSDALKRKNAAGVVSMATIEDD